MGTISFLQTSTGHYTITIGGTPTAGETYTVTDNVGYLSQYLSVTGDGIMEVASGLFYNTIPYKRVALFTDNYTVNLITGTVVSATVTTTPPPPPVSPIPPPSYSTNAYNLIYQSSFDPVKVNSYNIPFYTLKIFKKGFTGIATDVICAATPVIHSYQSDDPKAGIKGSSLQINLINDGSLPLTSFYSAEDDTFKIQLFWFAQKIFDGYLVQDDSSEVLIDYTHEIQLSANDNLGLLKDIPFNKAKQNFTLQLTSSETFSSTAPYTLNVSTSFGNLVSIGDKIRIVGTSVAGDYTIKSIVSGNPTVITTEEVIGTQASTTANLGIFKPNLYEKKTLAEIIKACLLSTNIELDTYIFANIRETTQDATRSFLERTLVATETFLKNDTDWQSCYDVLNIIMERFNLTLFQANGVWNIVRWDELRYSGSIYFSGYNIPGFKYDKDFVYVAPVSAGLPFVFGQDQTTYPEFGYLNRIFRAYKYDKETFNYKQSSQLLRNSNLTILGSLLRQYTGGTFGNPDYRKIFEYSMPWWEYQNAYPTASASLGAAEFYIRITKDQFDNELERNAIVKNNSIRSYKIEANKGDKIKFSFQFKMSQTFAGPSNIVFYIQLTDGTTTKYVKGSSDVVGTTWDTTVGYVYKIASGDNGNVWHSVEISSDTIPYDGLLRVYLREIIAVPNETLYKDIRLQYISFINDSTKITGQVHTSSQSLNIKNKEEVEIFLDSAPKNSVLGSLFLSSMVGVLQKRADRWTRGFAFTESRRLGDITTTEMLYWRQRQRTILEGKLIELVQQSAHLSMLTAFTYTGMPGLNFIWGKLDIDYRNNSATGTLWETHTDIDAANDNLTHDYSFDYIYAPL